MYASTYLKVWKSFLGTDCVDMVPELIGDCPIAICSPYPAPYRTKSSFSFTTHIQFANRFMNLQFALDKFRSSRTNKIKHVLVSKRF